MIHRQSIFQSAGPELPDFDLNWYVLQNRIIAIVSMPWHLAWYTTCVIIQFTLIISNSAGPTQLLWVISSCWDDAVVISWWLWTKKFIHCSHYSLLCSLKQLNQHTKVFLFHLPVIDQFHFEISGTIELSGVEITRVDCIYAVSKY